MQPELCLDIYLCSHVDKLCQEIRNRGIIQYFYPYLSVDLHQMAQTFNTETASLEKEICELIAANKIHARMDSYQKARTVDSLIGFWHVDVPNNLIVLHSSSLLVDSLRVPPKQAQRDLQASIRCGAKVCCGVEKLAAAYEFAEEQFDHSRDVGGGTC